jgi:hypothetical protein
VKVDPRALAGIERKIARAYEHFHRLHDEMAAWDARGPWRLVPEAHDQGRKHFLRLRLLEPMPVDWAVILGEGIHDLRSALDQAVYWLTVDWSREPLKHSSFPVNISRADFEKRRKNGAWTNDSGMHKIRGIGPGPQAFIEALQPYPQRYRRRYCRDLRTVHDLWNQDKHRLVHLWGLRFREPQFGLSPQLHADCEIGIYRSVLHDRAIVFRLLCDPPHAEPHMEMHGEIGADLVFASGKSRRGGQEMLWDTAGSVIDVIRKLTNAIGRQEQPINLTTWTAAHRSPLRGSSDADPG